MKENRSFINRRVRVTVCRRAHLRLWTPDDKTWKETELSKYVIWTPGRHGPAKDKKWNFPVPVPQTHSKGPNWASDFKNTPHMKIGGGPYLCISVCKSKEVFEVRGCIRIWNSTSMTCKRMELSFNKKASAPQKVILEEENKLQAPSYASSKLRLTDWLTYWRGWSVELLA